MEDNKTFSSIPEVDKLQSQFDQISSSYITITNDMDNAVRSTSNALAECQSDIEKLDRLTATFIKHATEQFEAILKRQDTYDGDMSSLHSWTVATQNSIDNHTTHLSMLSEKFDWYAPDCQNVYRYQIGDHIITFEKKLNWFRKFLIKLIFGSCEIR